MPSQIDSMPLIGGGKVIGCFTHASTDGQGWKVIDIVGEISPSALERSRTKIPRLVEDNSRKSVSPPPARPRTVSWLNIGQSNVLMNTIHAGDDDSQRPDNNFTVCLIVAPPMDLDPTAQSLRPTELIDLALWPSPWGPLQIRDFSLRNWFGTLATQQGYTLKGESMSTGAIIERIARRPHGPNQLRSLFGAIVMALHEPKRQVRVWADNLDVASAFMEVAFSLMPNHYYWGSTFEMSTRELSIATVRTRSLEMPLILIGRRPRASSGRAELGVVDLNADSQSDRAGEGIPGYCMGRDHLLAVDQALGLLQEQPVGSREVGGLLHLVGADYCECQCLRQRVPAGEVPPVQELPREHQVLMRPAEPCGGTSLDVRSADVLNRFDLSMQLIDAYAHYFRSRLRSQPGSTEANRLSHEYQEMLAYIQKSWLQPSGIVNMSISITRIKERNPDANPES